MTIRTKIATFGIITALTGGMVGATTPISYAVPLAAPASNSIIVGRSATINVPSTWTAGQSLNISGKGFRTIYRWGGEVVVVIWDNDGHVYKEITADSNGNFSTSIPWNGSLRAGQKLKFSAYAFSGRDYFGGRNKVSVSVAAAPSAQKPAPQGQVKPNTNQGQAKPSEQQKPAPQGQGQAKPTENQQQNNQAQQDNTQQNNSGQENNPQSTAEAEAGSEDTAQNSGEYAKDPSVDAGAATATAESSPSFTEQPSASANASAAPTRQFDSCKEVKAAGLAPIKKGESGFQEKFDSNNDGVGCDQPADFANAPVTFNPGEKNSTGSDNQDSGISSSGLDDSEGSSLSLLTTAGYVLISLGLVGAIYVIIRKAKNRAA